MSDRELLEMAAKAAGYDVNFEEGDVNGWYPHGYLEDGDVDAWWNPIADDGDALRLAAALRLSVHVGDFDVDVLPLECDHCTTKTWEEFDGNKAKAWRRAIVESAAEIGRSMP